MVFVIAAHPPHFLGGRARLYARYYPRPSAGGQRDGYTTLTKTGRVKFPFSTASLFFGIDSFYAA
jgi:hypothetical protein